MLNNDLLTLVQSGLLSATNKTLDLANSYKVVKFRNILKDALRKYQAAEESILSECGITDVASFDSRRDELMKIESPDENQITELAELNDKFNRYLGFIRELRLDSCDVSDVKLMPYEQWFAFSKENSCVTPDIEDLLCGILWSEPEDC